jgi:hypothetical protein
MLDFSGMYHGSKVTGILGAEGNNRKYMAGVSGTVSSSFLKSSITSSLAGSLIFFERLIMRTLPRLLYS